MASRLRFLALLALLAGVHLSCNKKDGPTQPQNPGVPPAPDNLNTVGAGDNWLRFNWHLASTEENGFYVYWLVSNTWQRFDTTFPASASENIYGTVLGLSPGVVYRFRVTAYNTAGESDSSNEVRAQTTGTQPPLPPVNVHADVLGPNTVKVSWTPADTSDGFRVARREPSTQWEDLHDVGSHDTTYFDSLAASLTTYYYRVGALRNTLITWSLDSAVASTPDGPPLPPDSVQVHSLPGTGLRVTWTDRSENELGFYIGRSVNGGAFQLYDSVGANTTVYFDSLGNFSGSYAYRIRSYNAIGSSIWIYGEPFYYGLCSDGVIPICVGNWWQYTVYDSVGSPFSFSRHIQDVQVVDTTDYYLLTIVAEPHIDPPDTLYYLRNFGDGCWKVDYPLGSDPQRERLYKYPAFVNERYVVDGDTMLVASTSTDIQVNGTVYQNCYVYQRRLGPGHTVTIYVKPNTVGIVRELEVLNDGTLARRDISGYFVQNN